MGRTSAVGMMHRTQALADSQAALKEMCPALRQKYKQLQVDFVHHTQATIQFLHSLGTQALDIKNNPDEYLTATQKANGVDPLDLIRRASSAGTGFETLKKAMQFASTYNKAGVQRLLGYRNKSVEDFRILWGHIIYLLSVEDDPTRLRFEQEITNNMWTPQDLHNEIVRFYGGPRASGGRPVGIPKTVDKQLEQIREMSRLWIKRHNDVWNGRAHSVYTNVMQQGDAGITSETLQSLNDVSASLADMRAALDDEMKTCARTKEYVQKVLDNKVTEDNAPPEKAVKDKSTKANPPKTPVAAARAAQRAVGAAKKNKTAAAG